MMECVVCSVSREGEKKQLDLFKYSEFHIDCQTFHNHNSVQSKPLLGFSWGSKFKTSIIIQPFFDLLCEHCLHLLSSVNLDLMVGMEAEIPALATSRQAGTSQSLLATATLLDGVSHRRGSFHISCLLRRPSPSPSLTPRRPSGPNLGGQMAPAWQARRGGKWYMMEFLCTRGFRAGSAFIKTIKQPSAEHPSALLMAQSHLPLAKDHLHICSSEGSASQRCLWLCLL